MRFSLNEIVGVHKISKNAIVPFKGTEMSACYDICACFHSETVKFHGKYNPVKTFFSEKTKQKSLCLYPGDLALVPTGLIFILPSNYHLKIYSRSGNVWKRKIVVANQPGIIDSDYTLETFVLLHNKSDEVRFIMDGDAIAQCELCMNSSIDFLDIGAEQLEGFRNIKKIESSRNGGFGHTDKN